MAKRSIAIDAVSVVVMGAFNPLVFSPQWLFDTGLIGSQELDAQVTEIITPQFAAFTAGWATVRVTPDTLQLVTQDVTEFERLRDLASGILQRLAHTPISAMGINREFHFEVASPEGYHAIGDTLAPKDPWQGALSEPGMQDVTLQGRREDDQTGMIQVQVQPSVRVPHAVYLAVNDHYVLIKAEPGASPGPREGWTNPVVPPERSARKIDVAIEILGAKWSSSMERAEALLGLVEGMAKT